MHRRGKSIIGLGILCVPVSAALGSGAVRDLPNSILPGATVTVTITLDPPPGTSVVAAEDQPPAGWTVSNISNSGTIDQASGKVKWGLFFAPSIPTMLSYDVTAGSSNPCFAGTVSYDGAGTAIGGAACVALAPAVSTWGAVILSVLLVTFGSGICRRRTRISP